MKTLYVEGVRKIKLSDALVKPIMNHLLGESKVHITYSIQYLRLAEQLKQELEKKAFKIESFRQVLGCSKIKLNPNDVPLIYVGTGIFHALNLSGQLNTEKILIFDGYAISKLGLEEINNHKKKDEIKKKLYLAAESVGYVVSVKHGQQNFDAAIKAKGTSKKRSYLFLCNDFKIGEVENFSDVDVWVNTACPRIDEDSNRVINLSTIYNMQKNK